jgi:hypothetical protein
MERKRAALPIDDLTVTCACVRRCERGDRPRLDRRCRKCRQCYETCKCDREASRANPTAHFGVPRLLRIRASNRISAKKA